MGSRKSLIDMTGIAPRGRGIQITFQWREQRCRETLSLPPTPTNLQYAAKVRTEIQMKIDAGVFNYAEYFPESKKLKKLGVTTEAKVLPTFGTVADQWLQTVDAAKGTRDKYRQAIDVWKSYFAMVTIDQIKRSDILAVLTEKAWKPKHRNNQLTPLRQVFEMVYLDHLIDFSPTERIKNAKVQRVPPDPFVLSEVDRILTHLRGQVR